jgi:hypothetical protein
MSDEAPLEFREGAGVFARRVAMNRVGFHGVGPFLPWTEIVSVSSAGQSIVFDVREGGRWIRRRWGRALPRYTLDQGGFDANTFNRILSFALLYLSRYGATASR